MNFREPLQNIGLCYFTKILLSQDSRMISYTLRQMTASDRTESKMWNAVNSFTVGSIRRLRL